MTPCPSHTVKKDRSCDICRVKELEIMVEKEHESFLAVDRENTRYIEWNNKLCKALEDAREDLKICGSHLHGCKARKFKDAECSCGFRKALSRIEEVLGK